MSLQGLSLGKLAIILIVAGVVIVFVISGFQTRDVLFAPNITEETEVIIKDKGILTQYKLRMMYQGQ